MYIITRLPVVPWSAARLVVRPVYSGRFERACSSGRHFWFPDLDELVAIPSRVYLVFGLLVVPRYCALGFRLVAATGAVKWAWWSGRGEVGAEKWAWRSGRGEVAWRSGRGEVGVEKWAWRVGRGEVGEVKWARWSGRGEVGVVKWAWWSGRGEVGAVKWAWWSGRGEVGVEKWSWRSGRGEMGVEKWAWRSGRGEVYWSVSDMAWYVDSWSDAGWRLLLRYDRCDEWGEVRYRRCDVMGEM